MLAAVLLLSVMSCAGTAGVKSNADSQGKPAILLTAFGSSYDTGQKNLEDLDTAYRQAFPDHEIYWAFTASFIVKKLRKSGQETLFEREASFYTMDEAMDMFREKNIKKVAIQVVMVMVGSEYREVINTRTEGLNVKYGHTLFFNPEDIQNTASALSGEFGDPEEAFTILSAHGNDHHPEFNAELIQMNDYLMQNYENVRVATVEGSPLFNDALVQDIKDSGVQKVKFIPMMLTYGDHITNDVMGDEEDSWKTILGMEASAANGMASNPAIQDIYIGSTRRVLSQF